MIYAYSSDHMRLHMQDNQISELEAAVQLGEAPPTVNPVSLPPPLIAINNPPRWTDTLTACRCTSS